MKTVRFNPKKIYVEQRPDRVCRVKTPLKRGETAEGCTAALQVREHLRATRTGLSMDTIQKKPGLKGG